MRSIYSFHFEWLLLKAFAIFEEGVESQRSSLICSAGPDKVLTNKLFYEPPLFGDHNTTNLGLASYFFSKKYLLVN